MWPAAAERERAREGNLEMPRFAEAEPLNQGIGLSTWWRGGGWRGRDVQTFVGNASIAVS